MTRINCWLLLTVCWALGPLSWGKTLEVSGRFQSTNEDSVAFVKRQLLTSAYKEAMSQELKDMNLDEELFWANYEQKLKGHQEEIENDLARKMKLVDAQGQLREDLTAKERQQFNKKLRVKKLTAQATFGNLASIISRYSIKKMSRSSRYPNSRYIKIKASVDRRQVHRLYLKFTSNMEHARYEKLYLSSVFQLKAMNWTDTGVEIESDFTDVVRAHWKEKLEKILGDQVDQVVIAEEADIQKIKLAMAQKDKAYRGALWMNINVSLHKVSQSLESQVKTFALRQEMTLQDVASGKVISFADIEPDQKEYSTENNERLSSNLAGAIYQNLLPKFRTIPGDLLKKKPLTQQLTLILEGNSNMSDLLEFNKKLAEVGVTRQFLPEIVGFSAGQALIRLAYSGAIDDTISLLTKMNGVQLRERKTVSVKDGAEPTHFYISE